MKMSIRRRDDWHCRGQIGLAEAPLVAPGADRTKRKFRVSGQALAGAVRAVGKSAKKVEAYLKNK